MSDLNNYSFAGRLAAPPEVKHTANGTAIWSGRVAVGYGYGDHKGTSWITIKALGKRAEAFSKWTLDKGQQVWGCGELQVREYERNDGSKGVAVEVLVEQFGSAASGDGERRTQRQERPSQQEPAGFPGDDGLSDDIPF